MSNKPEIWGRLVFDLGLIQGRVDLGSIQTRFWGRLGIDSDRFGVHFHSGSNWGGFWIDSGSILGVVFESIPIDLDGFEIDSG